MRRLLVVWISLSLLLISGLLVVFAQGDEGGPVKPVATEEAAPVSQPPLPTPTPEAPLLTTTADDTPSTQETQERTTFSGDALYIVQPGDVLDLIAAGFDVSTRCLAERNDLLENPNRLRAGQLLVISAECPRYVGAATVGNPRNLDPRGVVDGSPRGQGGGASGDQTYVIQQGDVLDLIAQNFDVSLVSLQRRNNLFSARDVRAGMTIIIPGDAPPYGAVPALTDVPAVSAPADQGGGPVSEASAPGADVVPQTGDADTYIVQPGDDLLLIAGIFNVRPIDIIVANDLFDQVKLEPGMALVIPR